MKTWPFGDDADRDDPLTELRIAVTGSHPMWSYLVAFDKESAERPTEAEAAMLVSFLEEYKTHWYGEGGYRHKLAERPLDVDGGANGTVFRKWGRDDWGHRKQSWTRGPMYVPLSPGNRKNYPSEALGPLSLLQLMNRIHSHGDDEPSTRWEKWKSRHPEDFGIT
ncbi:hypothetical protein [Streptomyces cucumeris]|uniref:hypothetical protein n=1 Tax=Streptomyces cucumeris TaxID=2962890 RepID=UPI0020C92D7B|nr:hypothetical protein [Streptomyces sp. NEAU-Y11]MCP9209573.1 hypothetical protein [Streptomyces sp. NEAU-Y11]